MGEKHIDLYYNIETYSTTYPIMIAQKGKRVKAFQRIATSAWSEVSDDSLEFNEAEVLNHILLGEQ